MLESSRNSKTPLSMSQPQFTFSSEKNALKIVIHEPHFDASHVSDFKKMLDETWQKETNSVTIDMSPVNFIDSSGIGALLGVQKRLGSSEEPVTLENTTANVANIIELLRLHRVFSMQ